MVMELRKRKVSAPAPQTGSRRASSTKKPRTKKTAKENDAVKEEEASKPQDASDTAPKDTDNGNADDAAAATTNEEATAPDAKEGDGKDAQPPAADTTEDASAEKPDTTSIPKEEERANAPAGESNNTKINLDGFGGTIKTHEGDDVTLKSLVEKSTSGIIIFTYPKASTPGCTTQACLFRDSYESLTKETGFDVYGLSTDSLKANTTFKTKQGLPYPLLCDTSADLTGALGLRHQSGKGTIRGVFIVDKEGQVLLSKAGRPTETLEEAQKAVSKGPQKEESSA